MHSNPFTDDELNRRLAATREEMTTRSLDLILLSAPEHVFYLTGLDHWDILRRTCLSCQPMAIWYS